MSSNTRRRVLGALSCVLIAAAPLASCSSETSGGKDQQSSAAPLDPVAQAAELNRAKQVDERFAGGPEVLSEATGTGAAVTKRFFEAADAVVLASPDIDSQLRAASVAVASHAPMLVAVPGTEQEIRAEVERLGATTLYQVGETFKLGKPELNVIVDRGGGETLHQATGLNFKPREVTDAKAIAGAIAGLDGQHPTELVAAFPPPNRGEGPESLSDGPEAEEPGVLTGEGTPEDVPGGRAAGAPADGGQAREPQKPAPAPKEGTGKQEPGSKKKAEGEPAGTAKEERIQHTMPVVPPRDDAPIVVAYPESAPVEVASARAYGAQVRVMDYPDPRINEEAHKAVAGLEDGPLIALGAGFGSPERLSSAIRLAAKNTPELPGGGHLVFPGRRMVALYGHPSGGALGVMGERPPAESVEFVRDLARQYQEADPEETMVPAFEIITTVAASTPGPDGDFSNEADPAELTAYIDAITEAGGYAVLDLQPGRARLLDQAKRYEELLTRPNVGLALDPEWKIGPDEQPLARVGHVEAREISEVAEWLAGLVREHDLPQKALVVHQFQAQMIRDRETVDTSHAELAYVLHADGHGDPQTKFATWNVLRQDLDPVWFMAWKNFFDEDQPMFNAEQTFAIDPRPWFVSYQ
ncbi:hypothetical protein CATYP_06110 [Corynebacterium atypicum]|uniref:Cell wall-binding repeat 2 family protein n=1 Tax=Corynebacterium atypicum TaxID=191610 RepID=A0ABN4DCV0_9CORY|nr:hypothetical protein [Corynebacterium atypicum]AIG64260.1 hypothetical protein CATYP_06110 [Corynebacterium atypicum]